MSRDSHDGFEVVAEGPGFVVIDKEPGVDFHDCQGLPGLCSRVGAGLSRQVFPVHRLDKDTSGILLLATTRDMAARLGGLFRDRLIDKYYLALSDQPPAKKQGLITGDMVRSRRGSWKLCRTLQNPARTRFYSWAVRPGLRLFVLKPLTGRTHQLRVAMKSIGAPILGDTLYHPAGPGWPDRMYLHAHTIHFVLDGAEFLFTCPPRNGDVFHEPGVLSVVASLGLLAELGWPGRKPSH